MFFLYSDPACLCDGKYFLQHGAIESARLRNRTPDAVGRAGDRADAAERRDKHKLVPEGNADIARYLCLHAGRLKRAQQSARTLASRIIQFSKSDKRLRLGGVADMAGTCHKAYDTAQAAASVLCAQVRRHDLRCLDAVLHGQNASLTTYEGADCACSFEHLPGLYS